MRFKPPYVLPLQTQLPGEKFEGDTKVPQEFLDNQEKFKLFMLGVSN